MLDVLLIAPSRTLKYAEKEVQAVINSLHPDVLLGEGANTEAIFDALAKQYDLVWFAGHSTSAGIELENTHLTAEDLAKFMQEHRPALFLNSCESLPVALLISEWLNTTVIGTIEDVEDANAFQTGVLFARGLAAGKNLREAFESSRSVHAQYVFLPGIPVRNGESSDVIRDELTVMRFMIEDLEARRHRQWAEYKKESDKRYHPRLDAESARWWALGFVVFCSNVFLFYSDVREMLGVSWVVALILAIVLFPVSAAFFMHGMKLNPRPDPAKSIVTGSAVLLIVYLVMAYH